MSRPGVACILAALVVLAGPPALAQEPPKPAHTSPLQQFVHGAPDDPTAAWVLGAGGRIYDNWWDALDRPRPRTANPAYPSTGKRTGPTTWRCVECHGWDYKGSDGINGQSGSLADRFTGIKGIRGARRMSPDAIASLLRAAPHNYTPAMITDAEMKRLATFIRSGQHDTAKYIDASTGKAKGDPRRGAALFQTTCAACHGFDGKALNWGTPQEPAYIGTEAVSLPWEVLHKIRNAHPGAAMISFRAHPMKDAVDVLAYAQTLPQK